MHRFSHSTADANYLERLVRLFPKVALASFSLDCYLGTSRAGEAFMVPVRHRQKLVLKAFLCWFMGSRLVAGSMPNDFDNKVKSLTTSSRRSFFGNFREVDVFRHGLDWSRKQKINRCKRVSVAQQSYLRCGMFLIEQVGNHARPSRVTRAVDVFTFVFHHPISLSRSDNKGPTNDDTIDAVIYRFLTIYAKTLQPAPFDCLFACERERRACHMGCSERGKKT